MPSDARGYAIRKAGTNDAAALAAFAMRTFVDTFAPDNTAADMALYTATAFGEAVQRAELADARNTIYLATDRDGIAGYVMLRDGPAPDAGLAHEAMEINRLYVDVSRIGSGLGAALMQQSLSHAESVGADVIWLAVWEHNPRAIRFYRRWGFEQVGTQVFVLGTDHQTDLVMMRRV